MRIHFDYNNVNPEELSAVLESFYKKYSDEKFKNKVDFGSINLYVTVRSKEDSTPVEFVNGDARKTISWYVKKREIRGTKKRLLSKIQMFDEDGNETEELYIYEKEG